ncbi:2-hydroxyacid dehydrogenase [Prosthecobacter sp.]|uniref:2-hydroxyacid dehydrogenase n=1 Tax=Prosthecobacter sp. TaxID=1965333 RepID=UPI001DE1F62F|nr:2-hydroxyacid dehydrogenase [Prosthecobacter sp.]MCB1279351.1 2-hydroxyacid dehydrogenase [Prosthecobacter sp.]
MKTISFYDTKPYDRDYMLAAAGAAELTWRFHEFRLTAETAATAAGSDAVCVFVNDKLDRDCLQQLAANGVRHAALRCAGFNQVDLAAAKEFGIAITRVPAYSPHAVAEHSVALLLTLNRKIHRAHNRVREFNFSLAGLVGFDLHGKTVGIIGTGKIGRCTAQIFRGFGCHVLAYDPAPSVEWGSENQIGYSSLDDVLAQSDILSLHLPLTKDTHHLLNGRSLAQMKRGAYLVNTSRGKLVDTTALIEVLKNGHLGGVALDVYEEEEGIFFEDHSEHGLLEDDELSRLLSFPNVLVTSHQAFLTKEALDEIARVTVTNLRHHMTEQPFLDSSVL